MTKTEILEELSEMIKPGEEVRWARSRVPTKGVIDYQETNHYKYWMRATGTDAFKHVIMITMKDVLK